MYYRFPLVAQLDNAADSDSEDQGFKSLRAGQKSTNRFGWCFLMAYSHSVYAFTRQAVAVTVKEKKNSSKPTIIAPTTLVAAKVIAKRTIANKIVPKIPASRVLMAALTFLHSGLTVSPVTVNNTARYPTAIPNTTQRKVGVTVIVAVNVKNAATTPIIALAIIAKTVQLFFLPQVNTVIYFHPCYNICVL